MRPPSAPALLALAALPLAGCLASPAALPQDQPLALPSLEGFWSAPYDPARGFHTLEELDARLDAVAALKPSIARIEVVGESREGRPIRALVLENRDVPGPKPAPFIDAGHHANEVEGIEVALFLAEFLVTNYDANASLRATVDGLETWIVPLVNPDGYVVQTRHNAAAVNLNRNYDLDWCDPAAYNTCGPAGQALVAAGQPVEYAGEGPFSEPESRAIRDALLALGDRVAFYLTHHTDVHCIAAPWTAPQPPFPVPPEHRAVFDAVFGWVEAETEYGAGGWTWLTGECMSYSAGGSSMDWAYAAARVPSFTFEVGGSEAREGAGVGKPQTFLQDQVHGDLPRWLKASLPVELFFLHNAAALRAWSAELQPPALPEA